ncbi:BnaC04g06150D [Brassica napus]|uniref:BnaC04g06150D protein n=2 Tax=Brassica napus TaxID=3708 RepID=A0A078G4X9_BRANA|nr:BnaC04g06150D [Brassica napus]
MSSLVELVLSNNHLEGDLTGIKWRNLKNLVLLDLSNTRLKGEIPWSILELKKLRFLGLSNNSLGGKLFPQMETEMPCLNALYVNGNSISGELEFSKKFYERMGRRLGVWGNPSLCYNGDEIKNLRDHAPFGVNQCKRMKAVTLA